MFLIHLQQLNRRTYHLIEQVVKGPMRIAPLVKIKLGLSSCKNEPPYDYNYKSKSLGYNNSVCSFQYIGNSLERRFLLVQLQDYTLRYYDPYSLEVVHTDCSNRSRLLSACGSEHHICLSFKDRKIFVLSNRTFSVTEKLVTKIVCKTVVYDPVDQDFIASGDNYSYYIRWREQAQSPEPH